MNKNISLVYTFVIFSLLTPPSLALAKDSSYVSLQVGNAFSRSKLTHESYNAGLFRKSPKDAVLLDVNVGTEVLANTFVELEVAFAQPKFSSNYKDDNGDAGGEALDTSFKTRLRTMSTFANLIYRFKNLNMPIIPYITAGIGLSSNKVKNVIISTPLPAYSKTYTLISSSKTTIQAAWQIGAGLLIPITKNISTNFSYKYSDLGKVKTEHSLTSVTGKILQTTYPLLQGRIRNSNILLGVTVNF